MWASKVIDLGFALGAIWRAFSKTVMKVMVTEPPLYDMVPVVIVTFNADPILNALY